MTNASDARPEAPPRARRFVQLFMLSLVATMVVYFLSVPLIYFTFLTAPATITFGILALVFSRHTAGLGGLRIGIAIGIALASLSILLALATLVFQDMFTDLTDCQSRAITITAQEQCQAEFDKAYNEQLERFMPTAS